MHLLKIADKAVGNMEVVALKGEQMMLAADERNLPLDTPAFYDRQTHRIIISQEALRSPDRAKIIGHEITHPLTIRAMEMFPEIRRRFEGMLDETRKAYAQPRHPAHGIVRNLLEGDPQVLRDVHEFIAQLYNDGSNLAQALHAIETPAELPGQVEDRGAVGRLQRDARHHQARAEQPADDDEQKRLLNDATLELASTCCTAWTRPVPTNGPPVRAVRSPSRRPRRPCTA